MPREADLEPAAEVLNDGHKVVQRHAEVPGNSQKGMKDWRRKMAALAKPNPDPMQV